MATITVFRENGFDFAQIINGCRAGNGYQAEQVQRLYMPSCEHAQSQSDSRSSRLNCSRNDRWLKGFFAPNRCQVPQGLALSVGAQNAQVGDLVGVIGQPGRACVLEASLDRMGNGRNRCLLVEAVWRFRKWQPGQRATAHPH
jgi:hypothetical protein